MKKFLAFLLMAFIVCEVIEQDIELKGWLSDLQDKVKNFAKKAWNLLVDKGIIASIKDTLISAGKLAANAFCSSYLGPGICTTLIGLIL